MNKVFHKLLNSKKTVMILLALLILVQLGRITYTFTQREGFHSDESWSYGFANSYYDPYIYWNVGDDPYLSTVTYKNMNQWLDGSVYRDYLEVNDGEQFTYDSVISNVRGDIHPPLHDMLVHTISSLFPNTFSWWYSYSINIVAFLLCQVFLFDLGRRLGRSNLFGLIACGFYGFTMGALNCFIYLRAYALMTAVTVILLDLLCMMHQKDFRNITKELIASIFVVFIGSMLHYYFYLMAFFLAAFNCLYLFFKRRWKTFFAFGGVMLAGVLLSFLANPSAINNMFGSATNPAMPNISSGLQLPYHWYLTYCLTLLFNEIMGVTWTINSMTVIYLQVILIWVVIIGALLSFLFRNEKWFKKFIRNLIGWFRNWKQHLKNGIRSFHWYGFFVVMSSFFSLMIIAHVSDVQGMGILTDRYLFYIEPAVLVIVLYTAFWFFSKISEKTLAVKSSKSSNPDLSSEVLEAQVKKSLLKTAIPAIVKALFVLYLCGFLVANNLFSSNNFMFPSGTDQPSLHELTKDTNVVVSLESPWQMEWYCAELYQANAVFNMRADDYNYDENLTALNQTSGLDLSKDTYIVIAKSSLYSDESEKLGDIEIVKENDAVEDTRPTLEELTEYYEQEVDWIESLVFQYEISSFCGTLEIYKVNYAN